jgi:peroxiredoxin
MSDKIGMTPRSDLKRSSFLWIFLLLSLSAFSQGRVYDFSLEDVDRNIVYFSDVQGETLTVIDFWATWCQPCIRSLPKLVEMSRDLGMRGVGFVGISVDSPRNLSKVKPFARSMGITYPVLVDPNGELMGELNILAVPTLLLVDQALNIVYTHEGFHAGDETEIREAIDDFLIGMQEP